MNLDRAGARDLASALREHVEAAHPDGDVEVMIFPPFVYLDEVARTIGTSTIRIGAQNLCDQASGAFTGEISAAMVTDMGAQAVLVGHSERRHVYGESDELAGKKVHAALEAGLTAILCVGETLDERRAGQAETVVARQLSIGLEGVSGAALNRVVIAYEPVWAIGTGETATPEQAGEMHAYLRGVFAGLYGDPAANQMRILYGGSVKADNVRDLMAVADIDGALVGGASLKPETFHPIVDFGK
ncbi:MAG: triosephosphate isomerase [Chlamydiales bacterium]|jgi:triosephosphate isomerase